MHCSGDDYGNDDDNYFEVTEDMIMIMAVMNDYSYGNCVCNVGNGAYDNGNDEDTDDTGNFDAVDENLGKPFYLK